MLFFVSENTGSTQEMERVNWYIITLIDGDLILCLADFAFQVLAAAFHHRDKS